MSHGYSRFVMFACLCVVIRGASAASKQAAIGGAAAVSSPGQAKGRGEHVFLRKQTKLAFGGLHRLQCAPKVRTPALHGH
eukprot:scaffold42180_cov21-Tisochrysis_lutea.AAC.1